MIVRYPNNILTTPCPAADFSEWQAILAATNALTAGMLSSSRQAIGLSAPQVGHSIRIFILDTHYLKFAGVSKIFINPEVTYVSEATDVMEEECMSLPKGLRVAIRRPKLCTVEASSPVGKRFRVELSGLAARAAFHEIDHLDGKTILDYASKKEKRAAMQAITLDIKARIKGRK